MRFLCRLTCQLQTFGMPVNKAACLVSRRTPGFTGRSTGMSLASKPSIIHPQAHLVSQWQLLADSQTAHTRCTAAKLRRATHSGLSMAASQYRYATRSGPSGFSKAARRSDRLFSGSTSPKQPFVEISSRPEPIIGKRQLCSNQHGHLNRARLPHDGPGISTVAPVASGWQTRDDGRRFLHQFNGT